MNNNSRLKGWGEMPKPQKGKFPKQYREKKLIKPVADPYGNNSNAIEHFQFKVRTDVEKDKKIRPAKVFQNYVPPTNVSKKKK